jgi:predicted esterase
MNTKSGSLITPPNGAASKLSSQTSGYRSSTPNLTLIKELELGALHLPRILCLHGGGSNASVFRIQCRELIRQLNAYFRFVFVEAPFESDAGPDVTLVYSLEEYGPFRRWFRFVSDRHPDVDPEEATALLDESLVAAMRDDDQKGATGEFVAVLGFSQGGKMAASLILRQQILTRAARDQDWQADGNGDRSTSVNGALKTTTTTTDTVIRTTRHKAKRRILPVSNYRFGIILAARPPLVSFEPDLLMTPMLINASQIGDHDTQRIFHKYGPGHTTSHEPTNVNISNIRDNVNYISSNSNFIADERNKHAHRLYIPTLHVHGKADPGYPLHRVLYTEYTEPGAGQVFEWEGGHRIPFKPSTVQDLAGIILNMAREAGIVATK